MAKNSKNLFDLTGLPPDVLADVLASNPRAYMALRGAVAERHLETLLVVLKQNGQIEDFRRGSGDFEKDFYVVPKGKTSSLAIECKNVQVINLNNSDFMRKYILFLCDAGEISLGRGEVENFSPGDLRSIMSSLPSHLRESGIHRYMFSAALSGFLGKAITQTDLAEQLNAFELSPLSIDFQRTRNSRGSGEDDGKAGRFYKKGEIDVLAACLFNRTLTWEFIFCPENNFPIHDSFSDRYSNNFRVKPNDWFADLVTCMEKCRKRSSVA